MTARNHLPELNSESTKFDSDHSGGVVGNTQDNLVTFIETESPRFNFNKLQAAACMAASAAVSVGLIAWMVSALS